MFYILGSEYRNIATQRYYNNDNILLQMPEISYQSLEYPYTKTVLLYVGCRIASSNCTSHQRSVRQTEIENTYIAQIQQLN